MTRASADSTRDTAFGQGGRLSPVDRLGVWLSARRIRRHVPSFSGLRIADVGCGYHATFVRSVLDSVDHAVLLDVAVDGDLKRNRRVEVIEGPLPDALSQLHSADLDVVLCTSVLEHLWEPQQTLDQMWRILRPGGICLVNVPSWRGKRFLEFSAFRLGLSPAAEMNDHKSYYDPHDLWPMLVVAGFRPQDIHVSRHKFGLNTFAACRRSSELRTSPGPSGEHDAELC